MPAKKKSVAKKKSPQTTRLVLGSSSGVRITLDHTRGKQSITLETPGGRRIKLSDSSASVEIDDGNGNAVTVSPAGITISAAAKIRINAAEIVLGAGLVTVDAGTA
ncbi:MAG: hypothetical protein ACXV9Q_09140, partial [Chthoniobacterales bacterium]